MKKIGEKYHVVFQNVADLPSLFGYHHHSGQVVTVLETREYGGKTFYEIKAEDGWSGEAFEDELKEI